MKATKELRKMSKKANRGIYSTEQGEERGVRHDAKTSFVEGTKPGKKLAAKSLTPMAKMMKKKK